MRRFAVKNVLLILCIASVVGLIPSCGRPAQPGPNGQKVSLLKCGDRTERSTCASNDWCTCLVKSAACSINATNICVHFCSGAVCLKTITASIYDADDNLIKGCDAALLQCSENCDACPNNVEKYLLKTD